MTEPDCEALIDLLMKLWKRWLPNTQEAKQWRRVLLPVRYDQAQVAINQHYEDSDRLAPNIRKFRECLAVNRPQIADYRTGSGEIGHSFVFVCRANYDAPQEMLYSSPAAVPDETVVLELAENIRAKCERMYGKKYIVVQNTTRGELTRMAHSRRLQDGTDNDGSPEMKRINEIVDGLKARAITRSQGHSNVWIHRSNYTDCREIVYTGEAPSREIVLEDAEAERRRYEKTTGFKYFIAGNATQIQLMSMAEKTGIR